MPLVAHLTELRSRLLRIVLIWLLIFAGLFYFANDIYAFISEPLRALMPPGTSMIATDVASPFLTPFKLTLVSALFIAMPFVLHQIWGFIAPGLYKHEKRIAIPLLVSSILLFYGGMAFAYFVVFPLVFGFFAGWRGGDDRHKQLSGLRAHAVYGLRPVVRDSGRHRAAGAGRHR